MAADSGVGGRSRRGRLGSTSPSGQIAGGRRRRSANFGDSLARSVR
jgi:hypothetical protein